MTKIVNLLSRAAGAGSVALLLAVAVPTTAHAAPMYAGCTTTGASGLMRFTQLTDDGPSSKFAVRFEISDTAADRHHTRVRLVTKDALGATHYWGWRANTSGVGTIVVDTTAQDSNRGINHQGIQVARFEKDRLLNSCTDWT